MLMIGKPEQLDGVSSITVTGQLDSSAEVSLVDRLKAEVLRPKLLLDLSAVIRIDTKGVEQIIAAHKYLVGIGCQTCWIVLGKNEQVTKILKLTGLTHILMFCDSISDGLNKLTQEPNV